MRDYTYAPEQDVVISSRVRLSRNYLDIPFSPKLSMNSAEEVIDRTSRMVFESPNGAAFMLMRLKDMEGDSRNRLVEHHLISYDLLKYAQRAAVMVSSAGTVSVMMNEEDHVRFQGKLPGLQLERSAEMALNLDEYIGDRADYAFDPQWGFLSACPANTGTAMRASVMLHLPALANAGQIGSIIQSVAKVGLTIRGLYGDGKEAQGDLYQLTNTVTLGRSEEDIIRSLVAATEEIVTHERNTRENVEKKDMLLLQDTLLRSWGTTLQARIMSGKEFMERFSDIRYAASLGYLHLPIPALDALMKDLQPGSLGVRAGHIMGQRESEILRARVLREELTALINEQNTGGMNG